MLDTPRPDPTVPDEASNAYVFEKSVPLPRSATGRIDPYRRGCFVLEAKQGSENAKAEALSQEGEARARGRTRRRSLGYRDGEGAGGSVWKVHCIMKEAGVAIKVRSFDDLMQPILDALDLLIEHQIGAKQGCSAEPHMHLLSQT